MMPTYCVRCEWCGWRGEIQHSIHEEHPPCDRLVDFRGVAVTCGGILETDVQAQGFPSIGTIRAWEGREGRSISLGVQPDQIADQQRRCPSMQFDPTTGDAIFDNDRHHRQCLRELQQDSARTAQQQTEAMAREAERAEREGRAPGHRTDIPAPGVPR